MPKLDLTIIKAPKLEIITKDGPKSFDPWELAIKLENGVRALVKDGDATLEKTFALIREVTGIPGLSNNDCAKINMATQAFTQNFENEKK